MNENINVFAEFKLQCKKALKEALEKLGLFIDVKDLPLNEPPSIKFGELATSICFELSKKLSINPIELAKKIIENINLTKNDFNLIESIEEAGGGYINFRLNYFLAAQKIVEAILNKEKENYGLLKALQPKKIIVEHTSVNPVHPIHIGQARNSIIGDAISRMLKARGHQVFRHYYIDDMGRQTAIAAYGYKKLGEPEINEKPDLFIGKIYSVTACLTEIQKLKLEMEKIKNQPEKTEEYIELNRKLSEWISIAKELEEKYPEIFSKLSEVIVKSEVSSEEEINELIKKYEEGDLETKKLVRKVSQLCINGFKETLNKINVEFDSWDWESDLVWDSEVKKILEKMIVTPYVFNFKGALELDIEKIVEDFSLRRVLNISLGYHLPSLTLVRSDGTTLYITRDIAYTIKKFNLADEVINVIGAEQSLAQLQLKIALFCLGKGDLALKLKHLAFGLVELPGFKMSSRRGRIVTLDEVIDEAIKRAYQEVSKRSSLSEEEKMEIAKRVGIASIKYALLSVEPLKTVVFNWDKILNFERNSAPFINYAYTRANGILKKAGVTLDKIDASKLTHPLEKEILLKIIKFPEVFKNAVDNLKPENLINFANALAENFHEYYEKIDVTHVLDEELKKARVFLIYAVKTVIKTVMELVGIKLAERM
ncbi:MAG: arginine--tRNA ligase [Candidatus Bathyarchaeia archaeon]|nr:arginine--tRNA ligase [Candidatus Bathyarchaeota archaeon]